MAGEFLEFAPKFDIGVELRARQRRHLQELHRAAVLRIFLEQPLEAAEPLDQALRIVHPVDADDLQPVAGDLADHLLVLAGLGRDGEARIARRVDADREGVGDDDPVAHLDAVARQLLAAELADAEVGEVAPVGVGLEADHIIGEHRPHDVVARRQGGEDLRRTKRDVQEEADLALEAALAQLRAHVEEVVVVDPDEVVLLQHRRQTRREALVDRAIDPIRLPIELGKVQTVVQQRPQRPVGVAVVEALEFLVVHVDGGQRDGALDLGHHFAERALGRGVAAPAEPQAAAPPQRVGQADGQPSRLALVVQRPHSVRYCDQSAMPLSHRLPSSSCCRPEPARPIVDQIPQMSSQ